MVNVHSRYAAYTKLTEPGLAGGVLPIAPPNYLCMLRDYIEPTERAVACPNQDVVYGQCVMDLDQEPVVVQVPDFGERFWVYQVVDQRTDSFASLGRIHGTKPGFYLLAGAGWKGKVSEGISATFRCATRIGCVFPRVFQSDKAEDKKAVQAVITKIAAYPLSKFDGKEKVTDWSKLKEYPGAKGDAEVKWVVPEALADVLPAVLDEVPPLLGEEATYAQFRSVLAAVAKDDKLTLPKDIPAALFWSVTVYDAVTGSGLDNGQPFPSLNTMDKPTQNRDGATEIYFGPKSPGEGKNWLRTIPDKGFFVILRIYGPEKAFYDKSWKPGDIEKIK
jgi:hypothetical protein